MLEAPAAASNFSGIVIVAQQLFATRKMRGIQVKKFISKRIFQVKKQIETRSKIFSNFVV